MIFKGIIHAHSTYSYDGTLTLPELKTACQKRGLSFVCLTEHTDQLTPDAAAAFVAECRERSDAAFVFVPGFEVPYKDAHVLHLGTTAFLGSVAHTVSELEAWRAVAPLVVLAHPVRNQFRIDETLERCLDGVEVWNQQYEGKSVPRPKSFALLASLRADKPQLAFGGVDLHRADHFGAPYTYLELEALSEAAIMTALTTGAYRFGHDTCSIQSLAAWEPTGRERAQSHFSILIISAGKSVNALLAKLGLRLPKGLVRAVRQRV